MLFPNAVGRIGDVLFYVPDDSVYITLCNNSSNNHKLETHFF